MTVDRESSRRCSICEQANHTDWCPDANLYWKDVLDKFFEFEKGLPNDPARRRLLLMDSAWTHAAMKSVVYELRRRLRNEGEIRIPKDAHPDRMPT